MRGQEVLFLTPQAVSPLCVCSSSLCLSSGGSPEAPQSPSVRRLPQLFECPFPYLPDPFPRDAHQRPDFLERHRLAAFLEAVIEVENLALARRQVLLDDSVVELAHELAVLLLLDLVVFLAGIPLYQRLSLLVG